ncbi:MAG: type III CRISPR-associated RAMP protein Csx7 [Candidatus Promineifilaceae bacterium]
MLKKLFNEARLRLEIEATGPLLIKSGVATITGPDMTPVRTYRNNDWQVYLPGSSLKGVVRSHLEKITRTLNETIVCDPFGTTREYSEDWTISCSNKFKHREKKLREQSLSNEKVYRDSCPICRLFGSTYFIGRIAIGDAYLENHATTEIRDGVGIDRLTGGASHSAKFQLEAVSTGAKFATDIYLRNFEVWQLGMLLLAVQDFEDGLIRLGSGRSRGLGSVQGRVNDVTLTSVGMWPQKQAGDVWGIGRYLNDGSYGTQPQDTVHLQTAPAATRRGIRQQQQFTKDALDELKTAATQAFVHYITQATLPTSMTLSELRLHGGKTYGR